MKYLAIAAALLCANLVSGQDAPNPDSLPENRPAMPEVVMVRVSPEGLVKIEHHDTKWVPVTETYTVQVPVKVKQPNGEIKVELKTEVRTKTERQPQHLVMEANHSLDQVKFTSIEGDPLETVKLMKLKEFPALHFKSGEAIDPRVKDLFSRTAIVITVAPTKHTSR